MAHKLMVVIPCYNEEEVLPETSKRLVEKMQSLMDKGYITTDSRVLLVNDGSRDRTWEIICELHIKPLPFYCKFHSHRFQKVWAHLKAHYHLLFQP